MHTLDQIRSIWGGKPSKVSRVHGERGSAIIEAGLMLPVLLLMTCGAMDFARVFFAGIVVESAARAGVQTGSRTVGKAGTTDSDTAAQSDASGQGLTGVTVSSRTFCSCVNGSGEVSCGSTCGGVVPSGYVETTASYTFNPIIPYPGIPQNLTLTSTAKFRVQ
jgi:Flp pilus assembly protein TadG